VYDNKILVVVNMPELELQWDGDMKIAWIDCKVHSCAYSRPVCRWQGERRSIFSVFPFFWEELRQFLFLFIPKITKLISFQPEVQLYWILGLSLPLDTILISLQWFISSHSCVKCPY
jgi:hypothetical protein